MGAGGPIPSTTAAPAEEKKVEAKTEESEESDDDMGFGLFHLTSLVTHSVKTSLKKKNKKQESSFQCRDTVWSLVIELISHMPGRQPSPVEHNGRTQSSVASRTQLESLHVTTKTQTTVK